MAQSLLEVDVEASPAMYGTVAVLEPVEVRAPNRLRRAIGATLVVVAMAAITLTSSSTKSKFAADIVVDPHTCPNWADFCLERDNCVAEYHNGDPREPVPQRLAVQYGADCAEYCIECDCPSSEYCRMLTNAILGGEEGMMNAHTSDWTSMTNATDTLAATGECSWSGSSIYSQSNRLYPACPDNYKLFGVDNGGFCCHQGVDQLGCEDGLEGAGADGDDDVICATFNNPTNDIAYPTCTYPDKAQFCSMAYGQSTWTNVDFSMYFTYNGEHAGPFINMVDPTDEMSPRYWLRFGDDFGLYKFDGAAHAYDFPSCKPDCEIPCENQDYCNQHKGSIYRFAGTSAGNAGECATAISACAGCLEAIDSGVDGSGQGRSQVSDFPTDLQTVDCPARAQLVNMNAGPAPVARWTFDEDLKDSVEQFGNMHFQDVSGTSYIDTTEGALVLDGDTVLRTGGASAEPGPVQLKKKTLYAVVSLETLDQQYGTSPMSVETMSPHAFDALVFEERQSNKWMAGSDYFERTQDLTGSDLTEYNAGTKEHLAIVYGGHDTGKCVFPFIYYGVTYNDCSDVGSGGEGTYAYPWCATATDAAGEYNGSWDKCGCNIEIFKDGVSQGSYEAAGQHAYEAGAWGVTIGMRHRNGYSGTTGTYDCGGGLGCFAGKIYDMAIYDDALTAEELLKIYNGAELAKGSYPSGGTYHVRLTSQYEAEGWSSAHTGGLCNYIAGEWVADDGSTKVLTQTLCDLTQGENAGTIAGTTITMFTLTGQLYNSASQGWSLDWSDGTHWRLVSGMAQRIQAYVDNQLVADVSDSTLGAGAVGFASYHASMQAFGVKIHDVESPSAPKYGQMKGQLDSNAIMSVYVDGTIYAEDAPAMVAQSVRMLDGYSSLAVKLSQPAIAEVFDYIQLKYAYSSDGLCASLASANADRGCSGSPATCVENGNSDLTLQACSDSDDFQFWYLEEVDYGKYIFHSKADVSRCLYTSTSSSHGSCEPYTLRVCDLADTRQQFVKEEYDGSSVWRNVATNLAIDVNSYANNVDNWVWGCTGSNSAKKFDPIEGCRYEDGPMATNAMYTSCLGNFYGSYEEALTRCNADASCNYLHDYNSDGIYWRYCASIVEQSGGPATTKQKVCSNHFGPTFVVSNTGRDYANSRTYCQSIGMEIASIHNQAESDEVGGMIGTVSYLGAVEVGKTGVYYWDDGTPWDWVDASNDNFLQPNRGETRVAYATSGTRWHDWGTGTSSLGVVCRKKTPSPDTPAAPPLEEMAFAALVTSSTPNSPAAGGLEPGDIATDSGVAYTEVSASLECGAGSAASDWDLGTKSTEMNAQLCRAWCTDTGSGCVAYSMGIAADDSNAAACRIYLKEGMVPAALDESVYDGSIGVASAEAVVEGDSADWNCFSKDATATSGVWMCSTEAEVDAAGKSWYMDDFSTSGWAPAALVGVGAKQTSGGKYIGLMTSISDVTSPYPATGDLFCKYDAPSEEAAPDPSELITGGGFEGPTATSWQYQTSYSAVSVMPPGWTITTGNVDWGAYVTGGHCTDTCAYEGRQQIDMCGGSSGTIAQTIATTVGSSYRITFAYNAHASCGSSTKTMRVLIDGVQLAELDKTRCGGWTSYANCWSTTAYDFVATLDSTVLSFQSIDSSCGCMTLDDVSVRAV